MVDMHTVEVMVTCGAAALKTPLVLGTVSEVIPARPQQAANDPVDQSDDHGDQQDDDECNSNREKHGPNLGSFV
jgi:hypothetical protein